jgi:hypothetical protein
MRSVNGSSVIATKTETSAMLLHYTIQKVTFIKDEHFPKFYYHLPPQNPKRSASSTSYVSALALLLLLIV